MRSCRSHPSRHERFSCGRSAFCFPPYASWGRSSMWRGFRRRVRGGLSCPVSRGGMNLGTGDTSFPRTEYENPRPLLTEDCGGAYWTRTSDPIDVNDVLYQLSQSTKDLCEPILAFCPPRHIHGALRIGSSVMYISQYVLPTEPCDHVLTTGFTIP